MQKVINLGKTIQIRGELTGSEDLTIEGKVEGRIVLADHQLTIGEGGDIQADIQAKSVVVSGTLVGNIAAEDRVVVAREGAVNGDIRAARVVLTDGCRFQGSIDMGSRSKPAASATGADKPAGTTPAASRSADAS